jgi:general secretion pathway protein E
VTGPTGSGKTTTLYAALGNIDRGSRNVMTIEDPVEYHLEGISQMQVNVKRGVTFAAGLRALLRQDPDVILVGEIRDAETAQLAIQASLTGHLVLATLHTNDAPSAIPRLVDIGIAAVSRDVERCSPCWRSGCCGATCKVCGGKKTGEDGERCENCFGTGYRGRCAVYEIMTMNDELRTLTNKSADASSLLEAAVRGGFQTMHEDAKRKASAGITTMEEIKRVLA